MKKEARASYIQIPKKQPKQYKDFVPTAFIDSMHSSNTIIPPFIDPNNQPTSNYQQILTPYILMNEWTNQTIDELNTEIYTEDNNSDLFLDPDHEELITNLPLYFAEQHDNEFKWNRPSVYVPNYYLDQDIRASYPKKYYAVMRDDIRNTYSKYAKEGHVENSNEGKEESDNSNSYNKDDAAKAKQTIYKEFYSYLDKEYKYEVVKYESKIENDEEYIARLDNEKSKSFPNKRISNVKMAKKRQSVYVERFEKLVYRSIQPSKINLGNFATNPLIHNSFFSWLCSIYQMILDMRINDAQTNKSILFNIYPQKDFAPEYNPKGKYIIKLYFMGKPRKIVIDDQIPCTKDNDFIFPICSHIEELWPALLTKALLKLLMYKVRHPCYFLNEELNDPSIIYYLTGYHCTIIDLNHNYLIKAADNIFPYYHYDTKEKKCYLALFNQLNTKLVTENDSYDTKMEFVNKVNVRHRIMKIRERGSVPNTPHKTVLNQCPVINVNINLNANTNFNSLQPMANSNNNLLKSPKIYKKSKSRTNNVLVLNNNNNNDSSSSNNREKETNNPPKESIIIHPRRNNKFGTISMGTFSDKGPQHLDYNPKTIKIDLISKNNIISNFLYEICDYFDNHSFNMKRLKKLHFNDLQSHYLNTQVPFKQLSTAEKIQYLQNRKDIKNKQLEQRNKRLADIKSSGTRLALFKIANQAFKLPEYESYADYSDEEITYAKKCLLNGWNFPPVSYFDDAFKVNNTTTNKVKVRFEGLPSIKKDNDKHKEIDKDIQDDYSSFSLARSIGSPSYLARNDILSWTKEMYIDLIGYTEEKYANPKEPIVINIKSYWIDYDNLTSYFNKLLIIFNHSLVFSYKMIIDNTWSNYQNDFFEPKPDYTVLILTSHLIEDKTLDNLSFMVIFEPFVEKLASLKIHSYYISPYIVFDIVELNQEGENCLIKEDIILNKLYSLYAFNELSSYKNYGIIFKGGTFPTGYIMQVYSEAHKISNMSMNDYLITYMKYSAESFKSVHPSLEPNKQWLLERIELTCINQTENISNVKLKVSIKYPLVCIKSLVKISLIKEKDGTKRELNNDDSYTIDSFEINDKYYIVISLKPQSLLKEDTFIINILKNHSNIKMEKIEHIDPFEISDKFDNTKKGLIFSEYVYVSDKISCSLYIKLRELFSEKSLKSEMSDKSKRRFSMNSEPNYNEEKDFDEQIKIICELYSMTKEPNVEYENEALKYSYSNKGKLLNIWEFYNELFIEHINLEGTKMNNFQEGKRATIKPGTPTGQQILPYLLICYLDMNHKASNELVNTILPLDIGWFLRVFTSDNIAFVKDYSKRDHETHIKKSWEEKEMGRSLLASYSRKRFLVLDKKNKGLELTQEEEMILQDERPRRKFSEGNNSSIDDGSPQASNKESKLPPRRPIAKITIKNKPNHKLDSSLIPLRLSVHGSDNILNTNTTDERQLSMQNISQIPTPKPKLIKSAFVDQYIKYATRDRTVILCKNDKQTKTKAILPKSNSSQKILTEDKRLKLKQTLENKCEESQSKHKKGMELILHSAVNFNESLQSMYYSSSLHRFHTKEKTEPILAIRTNYQQKSDMQNRVIEQLDPNNQLSKSLLLSLYKEASEVLDSKDENLIKLFNLISTKKEDSIQQQETTIRERVSLKPLET